MKATWKNIVSALMRNLKSSYETEQVRCCIGYTTYIDDMKSLKGETGSLQAKAEGLTAKSWALHFKSDDLGAVLVLNEEEAECFHIPELNVIQP